MKNSTVFDCSFYHLPQIGDRSGHVTPVNNSEEIPFDVSRVFYLYDIPGGKSRGAHAHIECHQFLIAASGAFEVFMDDGITKRQVLLNQPKVGLHIPPGIWASEVNFSSGAICLALVSHTYDAEDYIREYERYIKYKEL